MQVNSSEVFSSNCGFTCFDKCGARVHT